MRQDVKEYHLVLEDLKDDICIAMDRQTSDFRKQIRKLSEQ
jgi:hypothetical protein